MFTFGYTSRKSRVLKASLVLLIGLLLLGTRMGLWIIIGGVLVFIGVRDLLFLAREKDLEKEAKKPEPKEKAQDVSEEGKITITDLSDAKEVDFTKE